MRLASKVKCFGNVSPVMISLVPICPGTPDLNFGLTLTTNQYVRLAVVTMLADGYAVECRKGAKKPWQQFARVVFIQMIST